MRSYSYFQNSSSGRYFARTSLRAIAVIVLLLGLAFSAGLFLSRPSASALTTVPTRMNFQGRLTDSSGTIKPNGTYNMRLKLYTVASAGSPVWSEDRLVSASQGVTVTNGLFAIQLGSISSLPASLFASGNLYLEVELPTPASATTSSPTWTEGPMSPRNPLATSAYAYNAETLDGLDSAAFGQTAADNTWTGKNVYRNGVDSAAAFDVQNAAGASMFTVDTTTATINVMQGGLRMWGILNPSSVTLTSSGAGGTLAAGQYYYRVSAVGVPGETLAVATTPTSVTTTGSTSRNTITWSSVLYATSYNLYRSTNGTTWYKVSVGNVTSAIDNGSNYTWTTAATPPNFNATGALTVSNDNPLTFDSSGGLVMQRYSSEGNVFQIGNYKSNGGVLVQSDYFQIQDTIGYNTNFSINGGGQATFKNRANSTNAFQVQNSTGGSVLVADTASNRVGIANGTPGYTLDVGGDINTTGVLRVNGATVCSSSGCVPVPGSGGTRTFTKIVAASNSPTAIKNMADYVADGSGDEVEINAALTAAAGGKVYLAEGTYTVGATILIPNNTTLAGAGRGTLIQFANLGGASDNMIENSDTSTGTGVTVQDLRLDGQRSVNTTGTVVGVYLNKMGAANRSGAKIEGVWVSNFLSYGIEFFQSNYNTVTHSVSDGNYTGILLSISNYNTITDNNIQGTASSGQGITLTNSTTSYNVISGNVIRGTNVGITVSNSANSNTVTGNTVQGNAYGIYLGYASYNAVTGNAVSASSAFGINLVNANNSTVSANNVYDSGFTANNGIYIDNSDSNLITSNAVADSNTTSSNYAINIINSTSDTNYLANNTLGGGSINDLGTGTIYANQQDGSGSLVNRGQGGFSVNKQTASSSLDLQGGLRNSVLPTPVAPTLSTGGTAGSTTRGYRISALDGLGETLASTETTITTSSTTLTTINYVSITWAQVDGAVQYKVYRTTSAGTPATTGLIATVAGNVLTLRDTGLAASGSLPVANTTGNVSFAGTIQGGSSLLLGSATTVGSVVLNDGNGQTATIRVADIAGNYTYTIPVTTANDTFCMQTLANCGGGGGGVTTVGAYSTTNTAASGATISGSTIIFQDASASAPGMMGVGDQTFAGNKTFNGTLTVSNVSVSAGKSITVVGGTTGTRPASPTEGMIYFDTTTKQLLTYANGKWQADRNTSTKIVAASNSSQAAKDAADYVADGNTATANDGDQIQINQALIAAAGGTVYLAEGTYVIDASIQIPNNTTLLGSGPGTVIEFAAINISDNMIENTDMTTGTGVTVKDMKLDGRSDLNTSGWQEGIYFTQMGSSTAGSTRKGATISKVTATRFKMTGFDLNYSANNTVTDSVAQGSSLGFNTEGTVSTTFSGNLSQDNGVGFMIDYTSKDNVITNNIMRRNTQHGIALVTADRNVISNNRIIDSGDTINNSAIYIEGSDANTVSGNNISDSSATVTNIAIEIVHWSSDNNTLSDNILGGGSISDTGTGTIYANQQDAAGNLMNRAAKTFEIQGSASTAYSEGFNTGSMPSGWTSTGDAVWTFDSSIKNEGAYSIRSGAIGHNQSSVLTYNYTATDNQTLAFDWKVSSENNWDFLYFCLDTSTCQKISGELGWKKVTIPLTAGAHEFKWYYQKDGATVAGSDAAWLDNVRVTNDVLSVQASDGSTLLSATSSGVLYSNSQLIIKSQGDSRPLDPTELVTSGYSFTAAAGWTAISGTGQGATATHNGTISDTTPLAFSPAFTVTAGDFYQISFTITGRTAGYVRLYANGQNTNYEDYTSSATFVQEIIASRAGAITFKPDATFNGTISNVSIKKFTRNTYESALVVRDTSNNNILEVRGRGNSLYLGVSSGENSVTADDNVALGAYTLQKATSAGGQTAIGSYALQNSNAYSNTGIGYAALKDTTTGDSNTAIGSLAMQDNTTGGENTAVGMSALYTNTTGYGNVALGVYALNGNTTGSENVALGSYAGNNNNGDGTVAIGAYSYGFGGTGEGNIAIGWGSMNDGNVTGSYNINLGYGSQIGSMSLQNATAIGYNSKVDCSNCMVLGGTGANAVKVGIGTTAPGSALQVAGDTLINTTSTTAFRVQNATSVDMFTVDTSGAKITVGSSTTDATAVLFVVDSYNAATDPAGVNGAMYYNTYMNSYRCYENGVWRGCIGGLAAANTSTTGNVAVNTATEINFASNYNLPANSCLPGRVLKIRANGVYSTTTTAPTLNIRVKAGTTVLGATGAQTTTINMANRQWVAEFYVTCLTSGSTGTVEGQGEMRRYTAATTAVSAEMVNTGAITLNTTVANTIQVSAQWGTANASNSITLRQLIVESIQ